MLVGLLVLPAAGYLMISGVMDNMHKTMQQMASASADEIELTRIPDGTYTGEFEVFSIFAEVAVTVDGALTAINLLQRPAGGPKQRQYSPAC